MSIKYTSNKNNMEINCTDHRLFLETQRFSQEIAFRYLMLSTFQLDVFRHYGIHEFVGIAYKVT